MWGRDQSALQPHQGWEPFLSLVTDTTSHMMTIFRLIYIMMLAYEKWYIVIIQIIFLSEYKK